MKVLLNGALGKMGGEVIKEISKSDEYNIVCGYDREEKEKPFPIYKDITKIKEEVDVIIDFSTPKATLEILKYAKENKVPIVIATTGFSKEENEIIESYSKEIPIFKSANMSFSINLLVNILENIAEYLSDTDIEIIDIHHNRKVDSPSGTAILLADAINKSLKNEKSYNFDRMAKREKRDKNEIGFSSIRGGNIVGEHKVCFFGESEELEITHKAYSRGVFAEGALKAAKYIVKQKAGLYNMSDLVK